MDDAPRRRFRDWLADSLRPPTFADDATKTRTAAVLHAMLLTSMVSMFLVLSLAVPLLFVAKLANAALLMVALLGQLLVYRLLRRGEVRLGSTLYVVGHWAMFTLFIALAGGSNGVLVVFYFSGTVMTGVLLGPTAALVHALVSGLASLVLFVIETSGMGLPRVFPVPPIAAWMDVTWALGMTVLSLNLTLRGMRWAVESERQLATEREIALEALRVSEERYRIIFQHAPLGIITIDTHGRILGANPALIEIVGSPSEEATRQINALTFKPMVQAGMSADVRKCLESGEEVVAERSYVSVWGRHAQVRYHVTPMRDADGRVTGVLGMVEDISAQRRTEEQLRQALKMEAVGRLAGGVAHDFNNLLTVINGYSQLLGRDPRATAAQREGLEQISHAGHRAAELTKQLLTFSRRQVLDPQVLDLNTAIKGMRDMLARLIGEDVALRLDLTPDIGHIMADAGQIGQVLMNLSANARDAMPHGGALTFQTACEVVDAPRQAWGEAVPPGEYVRLSVSDTGTGLSDEARRHLFEPFFTTKEVGRGTGLGLSMVYGIVTQSDGHIDVSSQPGEGTRFDLYFPRLEAQGTSREAEASAVIPRGIETVLVIEDRPEVRELAAVQLEELGYEAIQVTTPEGALELLRSSIDVDLLLTDVVMPGMDGPTVADAARQMRPDLRVLFMSGHSGDRISGDGNLPAGVAFLAKPFTLEALGRAVRAALDGG